MKHFYFTIDFEDEFNPQSTEMLSSLLNIFHKHRIKPIIFITGPILQFIQRNQEKYQNLLSAIADLSILGYHTNAHTQPIAFKISDTSSYKKAQKQAQERETLVSKKTKSYPNELFDSIFGVCPHLVRFPGFSWTPPYLELLSKWGIKTSFDMYPVKLKNLPNFTTIKNINFVKPDYIFWIDEAVRKRINLQSIDSFTKNYDLINFSLHPNRLCNKEWWLEYMKSPNKLPKFTEKKTQELIKRVESIVNFIKGKGYALNNPSFIQDNIFQETNISKESVIQIYNNAAYWPQYYFQYKPRYVLKHFQNFFAN